MIKGTKVWTLFHSYCVAIQSALPGISFSSILNDRGNEFKGYHRLSCIINIVRTCEPPQEMAMRNDVADPVKVTEPIQSIRVSFSSKVASFGFNVNKYGTATNPKAKKGNMR